MGSAKINIPIESIVNSIQKNVYSIINEEAKQIVNFKLKKKLSSNGYGIVAKERSNGSIKNWGYVIQKTESGFNVGFTNHSLSSDGKFEYVGTLYRKYGLGSDGTYKLHRWHKKHPDGYVAKEQGLDKARVEQIKQEIKDRIKLSLNRGK
jgi:hypothetical protein